jgi:O-antigen ligase
VRRVALTSSLPQSVRVRQLVDRESTGALALAAAIPFLFLHERFQPAYGLELGSTTVDLRLSDAAIVLVLAAAVVVASRHGIERLRPGRAVWIPGALLLLWLAFQVVRPASTDDALFDDHVVTFLKLVEYALLVPVVPLLVRRAQDLTIVLGGLVAWSAVATAAALLQFLGLDVFDVTTSGWRYSSFLGRHDLAALSALALSLAVAGIVATRRHTPAGALFSVALVAGALGMILAGSVTAAAGLALGAFVAFLAGRGRFRPSSRRVLALVALVAVVGGGVTAIRSDTLNDFLQFVGIREEDQSLGVESYSQRTVLAYIGLRIFQDDPILGVGWLRSSRPEVFKPYLADARERFPDVDPLAFPAEGQEWGVQNLYVQLLADAGVFGLLLVLALGIGGVMLAWRAAGYAPNPWAAGAGLAMLCALATIAGTWASLGIVAGIPLQAATSLVLGLAVAGAAAAEEHTAV